MSADRSFCYVDARHRAREIHIRQKQIDAVCFFDLDRRREKIVCGKNLYFWEGFNKQLERIQHGWMILNYKDTKLVVHLTPVAALGSLALSLVLIGYVVGMELWQPPAFHADQYRRHPRLGEKVRHSRITQSDSDG